MNLTQLSLGRDPQATPLKRLGSGPRVRPLAITSRSSIDEINATIEQRIKKVLAEGPPPPKVK